MKSIGRTNEHEPECWFKFKKIVNKLFAIFIEYRILFNDILTTFLRLDFREVSLKIVYHVVQGIIVPKIR